MKIQTELGAIDIYESVDVSSQKRFVRITLHPHENVSTTNNLKVLDMKEK